ncbi:hypothetical protein ACIRD2_06675 [Streptomyces sp. NPDC093595]|uniref:hypothetical protein n=1 Tax=Streptomyces sp. NPDC093595 TaxID=3366045 RepID=UPI00380601C7
MARPRSAAPGGRSRRAPARGPLTALIALAGLLTLLTAFAPPERSAPAPRAPMAAGGGAHADDPCAAALRGTPVRVCRDAPGERHAPPPGGAFLPRSPALLLPRPVALLRPERRTAASPQHTSRPTGRAPPAPAGT